MKINAPRPGKPVRGSKSGKPIMALFDLLGRNWALGIIWQLASGAATFRVLQQRCENVSPTVLNRRLKELRESGLVERQSDGYGLSEQGRELFELIEPMASFSQSWAEQIEKVD